MSTTLAPINPAPLSMSLGDMTQLASAVAASKLFGMQSPDQALVLMAICQAEGKSPIQAVRQYHIINGRPSMRADAMQAEFQARGGEIEFLHRDEKACEATFTWGKTRVTVKWTMEMANAAGLTAKPGPWKTAPRSMLHARCVSEGVRAVMPGVVAGIYTPEEVEDMPIIEGQLVTPPPPPPAPRAITPATPRNVTPAKNAAPAPPPDWDAQVEFVKLAVEKGLDIMNDQGKPSGAKCREILCKIYGTTNAEMPATKALWVSALKALEVYQVGATEAATTPAEDDFEDPFKD